MTGETSSAARTWHGRHAAEPGPELPPGKGASDENFPVASLLISRPLRPHVRAFYAFARAADDVADSPSLSAEEKIRRLDAFEAGLEPGGEAPAVSRTLGQSLAATGVSDGHAHALLAAFRLDAIKARHGSWDELAAYCSLSAHPVGRYMLDLHGEGPECHAASDALTAALQVLNHLQDLRDDYTRLDRIYLPLDWLAREKVEEQDLGRDRSSPGLRRVIDRALDGCDRWLDQAEPLAGLLASRRLAAEVRVIHALARRLSARLRREDPLAGRVRLRGADKVAALAAGARQLVAVG